MTVDPQQDVTLGPALEVPEDRVFAPVSRPHKGLIWHAIRRSPAFSLSVAMAAFFILAAVLAPLVAPYKPDIPDYTAVLQPPSWRHLFGTDDLGRDLLSRVIYGARYSLGICATAVGLASIVAIPLGLAAGYFGGVLDAIIGRVTDAFFAFPSILMAIAIAATLGPSVHSAIVALALIMLPEFSRISRAAMLAERQAGYVEASRSLGASEASIIFRSILPNAQGPLLVLISLGFANTLLNEVALTFLGLGAQPPVPEWGAILGAARDHLIDDPWFSLFPGVAICLLIFSFNFIGDGVRDLLDPRRLGGG